MAKPEDTLLGINPNAVVPKAIRKEVARPPTTPLEKDLSKIESSVRGAAKTAAYGIGDMVSNAASGIQGGVRGAVKGITNYFSGTGSGLLSDNTSTETPAPVPQTTIPVNTPSPVVPVVPQTPTAPVGGVAPKTQENYMQDIQDTRVESTATTSPKLSPNDAGYVRNNETGQEFRVQKATDIGVGQTVEDISKRVDDLVSSIMSDSRNRYKYGGGLTKEASNRIANLQSSQITGAYGLVGHQLQAEATRAGHGILREGHDIQKYGYDQANTRAEEQNKVSRERLKFEMDKFNEGSSLKDPMNFVKALEMFSPDEIDEFGIKTGKKSYAAGGEALSAMGYPAPKGMKIPTTKPAIAPKVGDVIKGFRFKGGNPADKKSWEKV